MMDTHVSALPPDLEREFAAVREALAAVGDLDAAVRDVLDAARHDIRVAAFTFHLRGHGAFAAVGAVRVLDALLGGFHDRVRRWVAEHVAEPDTDAADRLDGMCAAFDAVWRAAPLYGLDEYAELTTPQPGRPVDASRLRDAFDGLTRHVREELANPRLDNP